MNVHEIRKLIERGETEECKDGKEIRFYEHDLKTWLRVLSAFFFLEARNCAVTSRVLMVGRLSLVERTTYLALGNGAQE